MDLVCGKASRWYRLGSNIATYLALVGGQFGLVLIATFGRVAEIGDGRGSDADPVIDLPQDLGAGELGRLCVGGGRCAWGAVSGR